MNAFWGFLVKYSTACKKENWHDRLKYAQVIWNMWKSASGISDQFQQSMNEERLSKQVGNMQQMATNLQHQTPMRKNIPLPYEGSMKFSSDEKFGKNLSIALTADFVLTKLSGKHVFREEAQLLNADFGSKILIDLLEL